MKTDQFCPKCGGPLEMGIALGQTFTSGTPDFPGDAVGITLSVGGPGKLMDCLKCKDCGASFHLTRQPVKDEVLPLVEPGKSVFNFLIAIYLDGVCVEYETVSAPSIEKAKEILIGLIKLEWVADGRKMEIQISEK